MTLQTNSHPSVLLHIMGFIGATCVMTASARAAVVVYDNRDGEFLWELSVIYDSSEYPANFLDITQPPSQSGERRPGTIGKWYRPNITSSGWGTRFLRGESGVETAKTSDWVMINWNGNDYLLQPTREYLSGERVQSSDHWNIASTYFYHLPWTWDLTKGTPAISEAAYLGVRTRIAGRWHYGWILFTEYKWPAMWAYETTPDTPIEIPIPAPGAACILLAGSMLITRRRRGR
ncbi:MAG: hypothetical protein KF787_07920 [Phycisphaeraceae bacterium]|nr:hypothetical protein [Phycisphaeraceae bacterium]